MIPRLSATLLLFLSLILPAVTELQAADDRFISIHIPERVVRESIEKVLPLTIDGSEAQIEGTLTIVRITDFQIVQGRILGHIYLQGKNLNLVTSVANQNIRLKLGSANLDFYCETDVRFDRAGRTLYLRPVAPGLDGDQAIEKGDIGKTLLLLINGKEFPVELEELQALVAESGGKTITITTEIADIRAEDGRLQVLLQPTVSTSE